MTNNWLVKIIDKGYKITRDIYIFRRTFDGKTELLNGEVIEYGINPDKPTLELDPDQLQEFANALNDIGINPKKEFIEGKLEATEKHLEDMRKLVFKN
jgi:hypothetical protein